MRSTKDMKTYHIKTFGCQMNEHDSQKIGTILSKLDFVPTSEEKKADLLIFNTCTVREKAHQKAFSEIGLAVKEKNGNLLAVCGCVAQEVGSKLLSRFPGVDLIFGPDQIHQLSKMLSLRSENGDPVIATELVNDPENYHFLDMVPATRLKGPTAFVTIMKGCNSRCSYCIVPKVRGDEVCRPAREIVKEVEMLVEKGCREVTLLGQTVNSYGNSDPKGVTFAKLLRLIADNTNVDRIRFTSPHPKDVRKDLIEEFRDNAKVCPHIHLPVQSGSDSVLRRMRRAYNRKLYLEKITKLREARPGIAFTTDIIVGFPGETDQDFQETVSLLDEGQFDNIFGFKYSTRPDTEAEGFEDDVPKETKEKRLDILLKKQRTLSKKINESRVGSKEKVLVEGGDRLNRGKLMGRTLTNTIVNFTGEERLIGDIVDVSIIEAYTNSLKGELL